MTTLSQLMGRYQLMQELGKGGMGMVYEGHDNLLNRQVAIKVLSEARNIRLGSEGRSRLLHEAQSAAGLNHPNIVDIYDAGEDQGVSFIVMELVKGRSLHEHKPKSIDEIISIACQICAALDHAHTHGIVHRDLKPENVLVTPDGTAKLTDFGLARSVASHISLDGMIVGTVYYLAPEAALRQSYDGRADLYSMGVMLYELTTGLLPFTADDPLAVISQHLYAPLVPPRAHNPQIPEALDALIVQLMSKQPEDRPRNAGEVWQLLELLETAQQLGMKKPAGQEYTLLDRIVRGRLIGREREVAQMSAAWQQSTSGQGGVLLISGEPGIGKTRLARELVAQALISGGKVMTGACYAEGGIPFDPFPQIIREAFDSPDSHVDLPRYFLADLAQIAPDLRIKYPDLFPNPPLEPQSEQQRIFESLAAWLAELNSTAPLLLFVDDIHWADSGTLALLRYLARRSTKLRLLILLTYREIELDETSALQSLLYDLNHERISSRIKLTRFDRQQTRALLASILSPQGEIDDPLLDKIFLETEGNPFFIEAVCKKLIEEEKLEHKNGVWSAPTLGEIDIPQSVRLTLQTRLSRLPDQTQEVLRCAAILGRQFDSDTLQRACGLDEESLIIALEKAERAQIISEIPGKRGPAISFAFAHTLIPFTLTDQFGGLRRQRLHRDAASAIESLRPNDYESLAYHYERAGDALRAQSYFLLAADRALERYANEKAERYYRSALEIEENTPEISQILSGLGEALFRQSRYEEATNYWQKAIDRYRQHGETDQQARLTARLARAAWYMGDLPKGLEICRQGLAAIPNYKELESPGVASLIHETARAYFFNDMPDEALPLCQHALDLARRLGLVEVQAETLATLGILPNQPREDAVQALLQAVELSESAGLLAPAVRAHANLGTHMQNIGEFISAREHLMRSCEIAHQLGIPDWEHRMLTNVVDICFLLGDLVYIQTVVAELNELIRCIPNPEYSILLNQFIEARMHRFKGEIDEALTTLRRCSESAKQSGRTRIEAKNNVIWGDLLIELGKIEEAEKIIAETLQIGEYVDEEDKVIAQLLMGTVRTKQGRYDEAHQLIDSIKAQIMNNPAIGTKGYLAWSEAHLAGAEENWQIAFEYFQNLDQMTSQLKLPWYRARALVDWAAVHINRGEADDLLRSKELLEEAIQIYTDLGLPRYAARVEQIGHNLPKLEFHISRLARDRYDFEDTLFSLTGNVIFANFHAARLFAQKMNQKRDLINYPERAVRPGQINAMGLIDEILHLVISIYIQQRNPRAMREALAWLYDNLGQDTVDTTLLRFTEEFPPVSVYRRQLESDEYLSGESGGVSHILLALEEMLMLSITNANPACGPYLELFDDSNLEKVTRYADIMAGLREFFDRQPYFGPDNQSLVDMLRSPAVAVPHSLSGQLEFIRTRWGSLLGQHLYRLLSSLDLIKEEEKIYFFGLEPATAPVIEFTGQELETERFSPDMDWMPRLVLIAKNAYVWLDQLSKKYQRPIKRLDQIPDQELADLERWGITGLWLIGVWERSSASKRIKQLRGNPEAEASAYSISSYEISADLGGDDAFQELQRIAWAHNIRLASDMVPNHMGIDSRWVVEHPDWFISTDYSPFPSYTFDGPDFSEAPRVGLYLEDHYFDNSDAAVVFKRLDHWTGEVKYIYHGNDGTSFPWNDTAQLNYLKPDVREAVIQTILQVARKFSVIRFDAAMTLAKRHYQRLWFPEPGSGGDIPSRAEHGMTKAEFDAAMPIEFWREVVDRVAQEAPGTLLLAEAFWLMEGYFVRTLGMHRVYNSAFMNMLRDEKNQEYRLVIKNTLEFDPEILKRYVNFMNNPDERTAIDQFGAGDKYFGICTMLATLPGLPMFGHGQIEGFTEKYGMEYRRAYWDEQPNQYLIERHERDIFPILRRRHIFAEAKNFLLYDFFTPQGNVNEDVFAYSNRSGDERALVIYNNKYASTNGWIRTSSFYLLKSGDSTDSSPDSGGGASTTSRQLVQKNLGAGLELTDDPNTYTIFSDQISGLEFIRNNHDLHQNGLYIELGAYQYHVFLEFRQVQDDDWHQYSQLNTYLNGRGVPSIDEALKQILLQVVQHPFRELFNPGFIHWMRDQDTELPTALDDFESRVNRLLNGVRTIAGGESELGSIASIIRADAEALLRLTGLPDRMPERTSAKTMAAINYLLSGPGEELPLDEDNQFVWVILYAWIICRRLGEVVNPLDPGEISRSWIEEWQLGKMMAEMLREMGNDDASIESAVTLVKLLCSHQVFSGELDLGAGAERGLLYTNWLRTWLQDVELQRFLKFNRYQGFLWFNRETFEDWLWWNLATAMIDLTSGIPETIEIETRKSIAARIDIVRRLLKAAESSKYQVEILLEKARGK